MDSLRIQYADGSIQIVTPSASFDGNYSALAKTIAQGHEFTYKILKDKK